MLVALDSNVFIAALSPKEAHSLNAQKLIRSIAEGNHRAVASSLVYGEVLTVSTDSKAIDLEDFFVHINNLTTVSANDSICLEAGRLRSVQGSKLKLPDAIHLVTAIHNNANLFVTNDEILSKMAKKLIPTKLLSDWV